MSLLSEVEKSAIRELRELVKADLTPYYDTDYNILRWIQGYNGNLKEAARKLRIHLRMRYENELAIVAIFAEHL